MTQAGSSATHAPGEPHQNGACDHEGQCVLLAVWAEVGRHMRDHLDSFTLADMVAQARDLRRPVVPLHEPIE